MPDRSQVPTTIPSVVEPAVVHPLPAAQEPARWNEVDDELVAMGEQLEELVDRRQSRVRRVFDVVASSIALVLLAPVMLLVAIAIKLDSPGPVFYQQDRIGINRRRRERRREDRTQAGRRQVLHAGKPFRIWKFRTMRPDAEAAGPQWAQTADPRVTRVGRLLRKTRLDEIPQFLNVVLGDMSLIGPRPERSFFIRMLESEIPHYSKRLLVKPGITGFAQVNNGYDDSIESVRRKVAWDFRYIRSQSPRVDVRILLRTIRTVLTGDGAC